MVSFACVDLLLFASLWINTSRKLQSLCLYLFTRQDARWFHVGLSNVWKIIWPFNWKEVFLLLLQFQIWIAVTQCLTVIYPNSDYGKFLQVSWKSDFRQRQTASAGLQVTDDVPFRYEGCWHPAARNLLLLNPIKQHWNFGPLTLNEHLHP